MNVDGNEVRAGSLVVARDGETVSIMAVVEDGTIEPYARGYKVEAGGSLSKFRCLTARHIKEVL